MPAGQGLSLAFAPDSASLFTGTVNGTLTIWDVSRARPRGVAARLETPIMALVGSPDGNRLAAACRDGTVRIRDPVTGREQAVLRGHEGPVGFVAFSPEGRWLASGGQDRTVRIWDVATDRSVVFAGAERLSWPGVLPDGKRLATGTIRAWSRSGT